MRPRLTHINLGRDDLRTKRVGHGDFLIQDCLHKSNEDGREPDDKEEEDERERWGRKGQKCVNLPAVEQGTPHESSSDDNVVVSLIGRGIGN